MGICWKCLISEDFFHGEKHVGQVLRSLLNIVHMLFLWQLRYKGNFMFLLLHGLMDRVCSYSKQELVRQFYRLEIEIILL